MKTRTFIVLMFATAAHAQTSRPDDFAGVKWGATVGEAKVSMQSLEGAQPNGRDTSQTKLSYTGGALAGKPLKALTLEFSDGKFFRGAAALVPESDPEKQFREMKRMITAKYGPPASTRGDHALWKFPAGGLQKDSLTIECEIAPSKPGRTTRVVYSREPSAPTKGADL